jgi:hypothetical protein
LAFGYKCINVIEIKITQVWHVAKWKTTIDYAIGIANYKLFCLGEDKPKTYISLAK